MRFLIRSLLVVCLGCAGVAGAVPEEKCEQASTRMVLTRPANGGVFARTVRDFRRQKFDERPFAWKDVDEKIDQWFDEGKTRNSADFQKYAGNWDKLRAQSKQAARESLAPVEAAWKESVSRAVTVFKASERAFYDAKPTLLVSGSCRYHDGQRDRSRVKPSWKLAPAELLDAKPIAGEDTHDTGAVKLMAAGLDKPIASLQCVWTLKIDAAIDPDSLDARPVGAVNTPEIRAWISPNFKGNTRRDVAQTWEEFNKSATPLAQTPMGAVNLTIGNTKLTTQMGIGTGFTLPATDASVADPVLKAGVIATAEQDAP